MRRKTLSITSSTGTPKHIIPAAITSIRAWTGGGDIAVVTHGLDDLEVRLDRHECREFIRVAWSDVRRQCPHYRQNACWFARQMYAAPVPPTACIKCQLTRLYMQAGEDDPRPLPVNKPANPLWPAFVLACAFLGQAYWFGQIGQVAMARAARAERELRAYKQATFKRQGDRGRR